jgi:bacterioferritin
MEARQWELRPVSRRAPCITLIQVRAARACGSGPRCLTRGVPSPAFPARVPSLSGLFLHDGRAFVDASPPEPAMSKAKPFVSDIEAIRKRARQDIDKGAMTAGYKADRATVVKLLNHALATEIVCVLRYKYHYYMASGIHSQAIKAEFLQHANEEQGHADLIAERITQLDGKPNLSPEGLLTRSHSDYVEGDDLVDMIKENLVAERIAVAHYQELVRYFADKDPTTRVLIERILEVEEEHADDMHDLLVAHEGKPMLGR